MHPIRAAFPLKDNEWALHFFKCNARTANYGLNSSEKSISTILILGFSKIMTSKPDNCIYESMNFVKNSVFASPVNNTVLFIGIP